MKTLSDTWQSIWHAHKDKPPTKHAKKSHRNIIFCGDPGTYRKFNDRPTCTRVLRISWRLQKTDANCRIEIMTISVLRCPYLQNYYGHKVMDALVAKYIVGSPSVSLLQPRPYHTVTSLATQREGGTEGGKARFSCVTCGWLLYVRNVNHATSGRVKSEGKWMDGRSGGWVDGFVKCMRCQKL